MGYRQYSDLIKLVIALIDLGFITAAFYIGFWLRFGNWTDLEAYAWLYYFSAPLILMLLLRHGVFTGFRYRPLTEIIGKAAYAIFIAGILSSAVIFMFHATYFSRLLFAYYFVLSTLFVLAEKVVIKLLYDRHLRRGGMNIRIAMIGFGKKHDKIVAELHDHPEWGLKLVLQSNLHQTKMDSLLGQIKQAIVHEVYLCYPRSGNHQEQIDNLLSQLQKLGTPVKVVTNYDELQEYHGQIPCRMGSEEGVLLAPFNLQPDQLIIKRAMDVFVGMTGILITTLLLPFIALAIKLDSPGPIVYSQIRVGKAGREFKIYKFRSMTADAERQQQKLMKQNIHQGPLFKVKEDPRITRVGHTLRKYSLDEFPQFWNVLKGDMSVVGTRPPTRDEVNQYRNHHFRRISIKPGLTGLWQVSGRNEVADFDDVVALDVEYIKSWNPWLDVKIIFRTISVVLFPQKSGGM